MSKKGFTTIEIMIVLAILAGLGFGYMLNDDAPVIVTAPPAQAEKAK